MTEQSTDRDEKGRYLTGHSIPGPGVESLYDPSMNDMAMKLALLGLTDEEIAKYFGVTEATLTNWKNEFPAFFVSLQSGKVEADANVAASLYRRAMGEVTYTERRMMGNDGQYETIRLTQSVPSDPGAAKLWLTNRQGRLWREKSHVEQSGEVNHVVKLERTLVRPNPSNSDR